ncbi:EamA family transporter [Kerstersia gyiorum]|uniref:EamA family transporter n=1 Tax=Kerstersia gyiorum TaxID=206506 RepID=UPI00209DEBA0|nr:EamA family transporter [Kerstersia gyiorum]MCP1633898.1 drug/metabolite transporter (DMT)-like permease [Kerstersia gyiorum]MCP1638219.1 drug/metabolite transporter (DMT)-like permease [Kerstersia gyiorum]MCP1671765.1 drug/metabolite transporter (DMT)-like permease [Kerstersia gyiorum]MCP1679286.1 drug/metabolite transporter (DMT)-like permease [Kerstersia gyiorum]MCP1682958.1 drug/metabolite transporter (DMT)-like permease [Kerstersia gyiorum]
MSLLVFGLVLMAAACHASWNAIVKGGTDTLLSTVLVAFGAMLMAGVVLPFLDMPARASWPFIAVSMLLQVAYYVLLANTYRIADMSQTYPVMRGTAPLIVACAGALFLHDAVAPAGWIGIAVICLGVLSMALARRAGQDSRGVRLAMINAVFIASYTLVDGAGVRLSGAPAAYTLWIFLLTGVPLLVWALATRHRAFIRYLRGNWPMGMVGGAGTLVSYGVALWAMTQAPVAMVSALRETSILFGVLISGLILKEHIGRQRLIAVAVIALGAGVLRLA